MVTPPQSDSQGPPSDGPRRRGSAERRHEILQQATRCFASNGFRGTTTREIAAAVGITEAAIYRYFPSKQSLYDAIIDEKIATPALPELVAAAAARRDDHEVFTTIGRVLLERGLGDPDFLRLFFFTALEGHDLSGRFFRARVGALRSFVADYVATRMREGAFRQQDAALCARAFLGMVSDYLYVRVVLARDEVCAKSIDEVVESFVTIFLDGVRMGEAATSGVDAAGAAS